MQFLNCKITLSFSNQKIKDRSETLINKGKYEVKIKFIVSLIILNNLLEVIWFCCIFAPKTDDMAAIVNPFIATGKVPAELFCDRKDESKRLIQSLVNGATSY